MSSASKPVLLCHGFGRVLALNRMLARLLLIGFSGVDTAAVGVEGEGVLRPHASEGSMPCNSRFTLASALVEVVHVLLLVLP